MTGPVQRTTLAEITCDPRPQLPDDAVDIVVKRSSALDDAAPWTTGTNEPAR